MKMRFGRASAGRGAGLREMLFVVGLAAAGVLLAAVVVFGPWVGLDLSHPPVVGFDGPAAAAQHG